ncbi:MAG TPA: BTAD domain-containing putative transcriptional regulator [Ilumatobacteraceae bacterium]|nr:BTAD domain-containing putative transcriptional regulator [Ilumatobacteraceae bacterium]
MRFEVLGPLVVRDGDGVDVTPRGTQKRRLLAALVAAAPDPVSAERLADVLWPGRPPSANAIQAQMSRLRRDVAPVKIRSDGRGYALAVREDAIDVRRFEELLVRAAAEADDDPGEARCLLRSAEALVRGRPYDDIADTELGRAESVRLERVARFAQRRRLELELHSDEHVDAACAELESLVVTEAVDEHWWALLMTAQYRQGRQVDALRTFQTARRVLGEELGLEPGPELRELEQRILAQDPTLRPARAVPDEPARPHDQRRIARIPNRLTSIIGRDDVLTELGDELTRARLVTLLGPGGAGKTTIATELARRASTCSVIFVEFAPLTDPDSVIPAIASELGISTGDTPAAAVGLSTLDRVIDAIAGSPHLLVLDNCEHVVDAAAKAVYELLEACPDLVVLATSREALGVPGEAVRPLPPLDADDATRLFVERAHVAAPDLAAGELDEAVVAEICARVDWLPLAIELAAARIRSMHVTELLERLHDRFTVLASGPRTVDPRQQTLRAVVDWSHDLLDERERAVFRRLTAFTGGASLDAAEVVCSDDDFVLVDEVGAIVERLIDKSLVMVDRSSGRARYSMLETLAEYGAERLRESGEIERVSDVHAHYFADLLAPALHGLLGPEQRTWIDTITTERENLRVAVEVAVARGEANLALRLVAPVGWYFYMVGQADLGSVALEDALSCPGPVEPELRAIVLAHFGWLSANGPNMSIALDATEEAYALIAGTSDPWTETFVTITRIMSLFFSGGRDQVHELLPVAEEASRRTTDGWSAAIVALVRGVVAQFDGDPERTEQSLWEAVRRFEEVGDEFSLAIALTEASEIVEMYGDYDAAHDMLARGIELSERVGFSVKLLALRVRIANVETLRGNVERAEQMHLDLLTEIADEAVPWLRTMSYIGLATIARRTQRPEQASSWIEKAWAISRTREAPMIQSLVLVGRGYTADLLGHHEPAVDHQRHGLEIALAHSTPRGVANSMEGLAGALAIAPDPARHDAAARLLGAADALRRRSGGPMPPAERFDVDRAERRARRSLGDQAFDAAFVEGAGSDVDTVLDGVDALL